MADERVRMELGQPNPRQREALLEKHKYIAFGGARGGGKSWFVDFKAVVMCMRYPGIKIMIVRKTYEELRRNHIDKLRQQVPQAAASYHDGKKEMRFCNGSTISFGYCACTRDLDRYQGLEVDVLFVDEATQFDFEVYTRLKACVRGVNDYPKRIYLTCNPGGVGHGWVKRLFVDRAFEAGEDAEEYAPMIQSLVTDNEALMKANPDYLKQLDSLPPKLKAAWRYGDWNVFEGQFFEEFVNNPEAEGNRWTHVIHPFPIPKGWRIYRSYDYGYAQPFSCGWWAVDHDGCYYRILEYYGWNGEPNVGAKIPANRQFAEIARIEREHPLLAGREITGVADPAIWGDGDGAPSTADIAAKYGIYFEKGRHNRINGWMQVHYRLAFNGDGYPMMYVFDTCEAFIRTIPLLVYDEHVPEDLDTHQEDHVADEVRYFCMLNPMAPPVYVKTKERVYSPLDVYDTDHINQGESLY